MKLVQAFISDDSKKLSINKVDIEKYELLIKRQQLFCEFLNKNLSVSKEDNLRQVFADFLLKDENFLNLWRIWDETTYQDPSVSITGTTKATLESVW